MEYNKYNVKSIVNHGKKLERKSLKEYSDMYSDDGIVAEERSSYNTGKGSLGQLVEEIVFSYNINSRHEADFEEVGMELKVVPLKRVKTRKDTLAKQKGFSVKERIVLSIINYETIVNETWQDNSLNKKLLKLLLMFYLHEKGCPKMNLKFELVEMWEPTNTELEVIKNDWLAIKSKVLEGKAHELSEGDTLYLGACTKGSNANSVRTQPNSDTKAKQRAFSLKRNFVDSIFNDLLTGQKEREEKPIFAIVKEILNKYEGKTLEEVSKLLGIDISNSKQKFRVLCDEILKHEMGNKSVVGRALKKAGVELKTICLQTHGVPKESMSFEQINYDAIVAEEWDTSEVRSKFEEMKHLWVVFKATKKYTRLSDLEVSDIKFDSIFFWNMPIADLDEDYKQLWIDTQSKIRQMDFTHFLKASQTRVGHIRPKAKNKDDMAEFNGKRVPKKAFWLNSKYIASEIARMKSYT